MPAPVQPGLKALFFDVFGTLVDWRSGVAREAQSILEPLDIILDWHAFADAWRDQYQPSMEEVRSGRLPYTKLDVLHRRSLHTVLASFGLDEQAESTLDRLTHSWHRLDAWPDVAPGLERLRRRYVIAPVSNGNFSLMADLARRNDFRWDAILGADLARNFKPAPSVYLAAAAAFDLRPAECMMCAAHAGDLKAAAAHGFRIAFIARPRERPGSSDIEPGMPVDVATDSTLDLASQLGA
jgi:2-haloacid dehalogenase